VVPYGGDKREGSGDQNSWQVKVVYTRGEAARVINDYLKANPHVSLKDATLAVGRERPELFK
jgi:hypothetical protein